MQYEATIRRESSSRAPQVRAGWRYACRHWLLQFVPLACDTRTKAYALASLFFAIAALLSFTPAHGQQEQYGRGEERVSVPRVFSDAQRLFVAPESSSPMGAYFGMPGDEGDVLAYECQPSPFSLAGFKSNWEWPHLNLHADPNDPARHVGLGCPLGGTSWLNRPYYAGWLLGGIIPGHPTGNVKQDGNYFGAFMFGKDIDHYWGTEFRLGFSHPEISDGRGPTGTSHSDLLFYDAHLLYYPWGDARWRPYATIGVGLASIEFTDAENRHYDETLFHLPIGFGVKYQYRKWLALRLDIQDNIAFGSTIEPMHNVTLAAGCEFHFGFRRRLYYPWSPGIRQW